jgi:hypothetical protein
MYVIKTKIKKSYRLLTPAQTPGRSGRSGRKLYVRVRFVEGTCKYTDKYFQGKKGRNSITSSHYITVVEHHHHDYITTIIIITIIILQQRGQFNHTHRVWHTNRSANLGTSN